MLKKYSSQGGEKRNLIILAFPTNDFRQETGTNDQIKEKVKTMMGPDLYNNPNFILFQKSSLRQNPVYKLLGKHIPDKMVKHNFYKYLIDSQGIPVSFHVKKETLVDFEKDIAALSQH